MGSLALSKNISKKEHPHRDLSTTLRFGRDDKGEGSASRENCCMNRNSLGTVGPPKLKNGFCSATSLSRSAALPFVISTEAQRSGEISVWMLFPGKVFSYG
jgi:hypothetical protein